MKKALSIGLLMLLLLTSVPVDTESAAPGQWTVMIYMGGGYEQGISDAMRYDIAEMERAGYHDGFNIIILKDGTGYGDSECLVLRNDGFDSVPLRNINVLWSDELDMSNPNTLSDFAEWGLNEYPASHSMLVMWGHGRGWMGMPDDEGGSVMDMLSFSTALKEITESHGTLDVIGFDQCNMAMFEVFYQIAPYAKYAVASEKEEDMAGWPYDVLLSDIYNMNNPSGRNVSMQVVRDYVSWAANNSAYSATMSAIDLSKMDLVGSALSSYSGDLRLFLPYYKEEMAASRESSESYDKLPYPYDLANLTENIRRKIGFPELKISGNSLSDAVDDAVLLEMHHTVESDMSVEGASGMAIWFPSYGSRNDYDLLRVNYTGWPSFLDDYLSSVPPVNTASINMSVREVDGDGDGANESFVVSAQGNGDIHLDVYFGDDIIRSVQGYGNAELRFRWDPGYFTVLSYLMNGSSIENFTADTAVIERNLVIYGHLTDFMDQPASALVEVLTSEGVFGTDARDTYEIRLKAPYDFMPGENARLRVCSGGNCQEQDIVLEGTEICRDVGVSSGPGWPPYAAGLSVFIMGAIGYVLLFDSSRKDKRMKRFKKVRRLKRMKKVMWVKNITNRQEELAELMNALNRAKKGTGGTIFLTGEEGVGKRTLMEKFRQESGVKSVFYECKGASTGQPYEPIRKALEMLYSISLLKSDPAGLFEKSGKEQMMESVFQAMKNASSDEPVLLSIFNAQWLDEASIELMKYVSRGLSDTKMLLVLAAPQEELEDVGGKPHPLNSMLMELIMEGKVRMIKLERFGLEDARNMLENILGRDVPDDALNKIYDMTRGLPVMIEEIAIAIRKSGVDLNDPDSLEIEIPSTVKDLVSRRLSKLDDKEREVAEWAAVLGNSFSYEELRELSGSEDLNTILYALIEDKILTEEGGSYFFDHPEIRNSLLESLGDRAKEMHRKAGKMMEERMGTSYDLAYQFCLGGDRERCLKYSIMAAKDAEKSYAYKEAIEYYEKALELADPSQIADIYLGLSSNYHKIMEYDKAAEYADKVVYSEAPDEKKYLAYSMIGKCHLENSRWDEAKEAYEKLLDSPDRRMKLDAYRGLGKIYWRIGQHEKAAEYARRAIELASDIDDMVLVGSMKVDLANIYYDKGNYEMAEKLYLEAIDILEKEGAITELARTYNNLGEIYRYTDRPEKAIESYMKCIRYAKESNNINTMGYGLENTGTVYASMGRLEEAKKYLSDAHRIFSKTGNKYMISGIHMAYGIIYAKEGLWDKAEENFRISIDMLVDIDVKYDLGISYLEYARAMKEKGDKKKAKELYEKARGIFADIGSEEHLRKIGEEIAEL